MPFTLLPDESPSVALRRIALEQIDGATVQLQRVDDPNEGIHEARKRFKCIRALLRLARDALPDETYRSENIFFRDQGRILSPARDSAVYIETFDLLRERYDAQMTDKAFLNLRRTLVSEHKAILKSFIENKRLLSELIEALQRARRRAQDWNVNATGFDAFAPGLRRIYARGRTEKRVAYAQPSTENFHAWRKRVKYLWRHYQILQPLWPALMKVLIRDCDLLADRLGEEHDLAVLQESPYVQDLLGAKEESVELLFSIVACERRRQRSAAASLADRIYAERPRPFVNRIKGYWEAYHPGSR